MESWKLCGNFVETLWKIIIMDYKATRNAIHAAIEASINKGVEMCASQFACYETAEALGGLYAIEQREESEGRQVIEPSALAMYLRLCENSAGWYGGTRRETRFFELTMRRRARSISKAQVIEAEGGKGQYPRGLAHLLNRMKAAGVMLEPSALELIAERGAHKASARATTIEGPSSFSCIEPSYMNFERYVQPFESDAELSALYKAFSGVVSPSVVADIFAAYHVGLAAVEGHNYTIFPQIDCKGRVHTAKAVEYMPGGKRSKKAGGVNWLHNLCFTDKENYNLEQCLFGLHLLEGKPEALVIVSESEKNALAIAMVLADYRTIDFVSLSCGGKENFKPAMLEPLKGRRVLVVPDVDAAEAWGNTFRHMKAAGFFDKAAFYPSMEHDARDVNITDTSKADAADVVLQRPGAAMLLALRLAEYITKNGLTNN